MRVQSDRHRAFKKLDILFCGSLIVKLNLITVFWYKSQNKKKQKQKKQNKNRLVVSDKRVNCNRESLIWNDRKERVFGIKLDPKKFSHQILVPQKIVMKAS